MDQLLATAQENSSSGSGFSTVWYIIGAIGLWKMFEKMGVEGWAGIIPFYREYKLCEKVMGRPWYFLRELWVVVPFIGWALAIYYKYQIGKATALAFGKPESWAWGYTFLDAVFYCLTGFDASSYYGMYGSGDTRTGEAREAKTVDFDVEKNMPDPVVPNPESRIPNPGPKPSMYDEVMAEPVKPAPHPSDDRANKVEEVVAEPVNESDVDFEFNQDVEE